MTQDELRETEQLRKKLIIGIETALTEKNEATETKIEPVIWDLCSYIDQFNDSVIIDILKNKGLDIVPFVIAISNKAAYHQKRAVNRLFELVAERMPQFVLRSVSTISELISYYSVNRVHYLGPKEAGLALYKIAIRKVPGFLNAILPKIMPFHCLRS